MTASTVAVTVVLSPRPREVREWHLDLPTGSTVLDALTHVSGLSELLVEAGLPDQIDQCTAGIWGRKSELTAVLRNFDRVEIYRPLKVDPKLARRQRFAKQGRRSAGLFVKKTADRAKPGAKN